MIKTRTMGIAFLFFVFVFSIFTCCHKTNEETLSLSVSPDSIVIEVQGGSEQLLIKGNNAWTLLNTSDWLSESINSGDGDATVTFTATENKEVATRRTVVVITTSEKTIEIPIFQYGVDSWGGFSFDIDPDDTDMRTLTMSELSSEMKAGWNVGNSLEAIGGETAWGNPLITKKLIDSVKAAGFNMIRIPVAWSVFSDEDNYIIEEDWLNRVEDVVGYVIDNEMYVMINIHWDGGWMEPTYEAQNEVNYRLEKMWRQIATHFRKYGDHLLFAGTNEVHVENEYGAPTEENCKVQNEFNQIFITTVRKTGGKNVYRYLIVQAYNTNIDYAVKYAEIPEDVVDDRMLMEVHYYDPYNFALNENSTITQWGNIATDNNKVETWANESFVDGQFKKMKTNFIDKGVGVILGEYGAISRTDVEGHEGFREYYIQYITQSAADNGLVPVYWDNGHSGNHGFAIFDRSSGEQLYPDIINAIIKPYKQ